MSNVIIARAATRAFARPSDAGGSAWCVDIYVNGKWVGTRSTNPNTDELLRKPAAMDLAARIERGEIGRHDP